MPDIFKEALKIAASSLLGLCGLALGLLIWRILLLRGVDPDTSLSVAVAIASAAILFVAVPILMFVGMRAVAPRFIDRLTGKLDCYFALLDGTFRTEAEYRAACELLQSESARTLGAPDVTEALTSDEPPVLPGKK